MSDLFGNHIVGCPTRWLIRLLKYIEPYKTLSINESIFSMFTMLIDD